MTSRTLPSALRDSPCPDEDRIATLVRERDEAREECGVAKGHRDTLRYELDVFIRKTMALELELRAALDELAALRDTP